MEEAIILKISHIRRRILHGQGKPAANVKRKAQADGGESGGHPEGGIAMYEGDQYGNPCRRREITVEITPEKIDMILDDKGPGIKDVELAMQAGYSTAPDEIRSLGFGAGMGLPNMKKYSDQMEIDTRIGEGTKITMTVYI